MLNFAVPPGSLDAVALARSVSATSMLQALQRYLPPRDQTSWEACELARVRYVPGQVWRVLYRLWKTGQARDDEPSDYSAEFLPPSRALRRFLDLRAQSGASAPSGFVAELDMVYWRFPADPQLEQLPALYRDGCWRVVSYVPGTTCVLTGAKAGEPRILKLYRDDRAERVGRVIEALRQAGVTAPRVLDIDVARRFLVLEHVPGVLFWSDPASHLEKEVVGAMAREAMEEAMRRMEAGEDTDAIDEELGDMLEGQMPFGDDESPLTKEGRTRWKTRRRPPARDETLYSL